MDLLLVVALPVALLAWWAWPRRTASRRRLLTRLLAFLVVPPGAVWLLYEAAVWPAVVALGDPEHSSPLTFVFLLTAVGIAATWLLGLPLLAGAAAWVAWTRRGRGGRPRRLALERAR